MKIDKALKRDHARQKARHGMKINGKSVFVIQAELIKRGSNQPVSSALNKKESTSE